MLSASISTPIPISRLRPIPRPAIRTSLTPIPRPRCTPEFLPIDVDELEKIEIGKWKKPDEYQKIFSISGRTG